MLETTPARPEMQSSQGSLHLLAAQSPFLFPSLANILLTITADHKNWEGERSESGDGSALQSKSLTSKALGTQALPCILKLNELLKHLRKIEFRI